MARVGFEQIKLIGPLTDPTKYGGRAEDAFDVVIPSLPGFGFSARPTEAGWGLERIGRTNLSAAVTNDVGAALGGGPAPAGFSEQERAAVDDLRTYLHNGGLAYPVMMGARPQAGGYGLTDSPAGLAGWMLVHGGFDKWSYGKDPKQSPTRDDVLDNFTLYWLTNTAASSARIYWENRG